VAGRLPPAAGDRSSRPPNARGVHNGDILDEAPAASSSSRVTTQTRSHRRQRLEPDVPDADPVDQNDG
jgi:hypothetical protein